MKRKGVAGGAATAGGINFQSAVTAIAYVHMGMGRQLLWLEKLVVDVPVALEAETNGPGDDLFIRLKSGESVEVQVKKGLRVGKHLWNALTKLAVAISKDEIDYGILVISPSSSRTISDDLCIGIVRIGDGRTDNLSATATKFVERLRAANLPLDVCRKIRIQTICAVTGNDAHATAARSELSQLCSASSQVPLAWDVLCRDASTLIEQRGRRNASSVLQLLLVSNIRLTDRDSSNPALLLKRLCQWVFETNRCFSVFGVQRLLETDGAWIPLDAILREERVEAASDLAEALKHYHSWDSRYSSSNSSRINPETLARFVTRVILVGGPGMGKTTLLKRIARRYSEENIPVLKVRLPAVAARICSGSTFEEAILSLGLDGCGIGVSEAQNAAFPNWLLLCDGLDECGKFQEQIADGIVRFADGHKDCRLIVTTRSVGYDAAHFDEWRHYYLKPLDSSAAVGHLTNLITHCAPVNSPLRNKDHAYEVCSRELKDEGICNIVSRTPLMLTLAASIIVQGGKLGNSREQLFEQIFERIDAIPNARSPEPPATASVLNYFLNIAGWEIVTKPVSAVSAILDACAVALAAETGKSRLSARSDAEAFLNYWQNAGLIEKVGFGGEETLVFIHKSFGEFAAARWVCSLSSDRQKIELTSLMCSPQCIEVVRFAGLSGPAELVCELLVQEGADQREMANRISLAVELLAFSNPPPAQPIRKTIVGAAIGLADCERRDLAFEAGRALPAASRRFPQEVTPSLAPLTKSEQNWTHLIAWAALSAAGADFYDREDLIDAFVSIAKEAGSAFRPSLGGGMSLRLGKDPEREILETFLLTSASFLLDSDSEAYDGIVHDALNSEGLQTMSFIEKANALAKSKGKDWQIGRFDTSRWAQAFKGTEGYESAQLAMFDAIFDALDISSGPEAELGEPAELLYLSAFLQVSSFWEMPAYDVWAWTKEYDRYATAEVLNGVVSVSGIDVECLRNDLVKARAFLDAHGVNALFKMITHVDPSEPDWHVVSEIEMDIGKVEAGIYHPSQWIVMLAAHLIMHAVSPEELRPIVLRLFVRGRGHALWAASVLATDLERADMLSITVDRLSGNLVSGCEYLFKLLVKQELPLDDNLYVIFQTGLKGDVDIAVEAAKLASSVAKSGDDRLAAIVADAFRYWKETEEPYPVGGGVIPNSPRADLLAALLQLNITDYEDLKSHIVDERTDVRDAATGEIVGLVAESEQLRLRFLEDVARETMPPKVFSAAIAKIVPLTEQEWEGIKALLSHSNPRIRYAALAALEQECVDPEAIESLATALTSDREQEIADRAYRILDSLRKSVSS